MADRFSDIAQVVCRPSTFGYVAAAILSHLAPAVQITIVDIDQLNSLSFDDWQAGSQVVLTGFEVHFTEKEREEVLNFVQRFTEAGHKLDAVIDKLGSVSILPAIADKTGFIEGVRDYYDLLAECQDLAFCQSPADSNLLAWLEDVATIGRVGKAGNSLAGYVDNSLAGRWVFYKANVENATPRRMIQYFARTRYEVSLEEYNNLCTQAGTKTDGSPAFLLPYQN